MTTSTRKARRAWAAIVRKHIRPGHVVHLEVRHDDWCGIYTQERTCNCSPDRVLKDDKGHVLARVRGAGFYDPMEHLEVLK
ncbi:hypothetical protein KBY27_20270 [Ruegeria pomeroyi]|uniref:Uncharacterized protein n=1 Tax=Ruegeria pomeroyi TaxID=89184 RepID=A0A9Q3ZRD3_9RHOB|nr:hypothetical protein [Ruegeria pomeroyi]MCE8539804.1 hypothetical protein [Ruegeria pomeroyi]